MRQEEILIDEPLNSDDPTGIPFDDVIEAISLMRYASVERVMFEMLFLTGARIAELEKMELKNLHGCMLYWRLGKRQHRWRKEMLPMEYLKELNVYREQNKVYGNRIFGIDAQSFRRYFNGHVRPTLPEKWRIKKRDYEGNIQAWTYLYKIKGLRKDFWTLDYAKNLKKHKDVYYALLMTMKHAQHKTEKITAIHYISEFDNLRVNDYTHKTTADMLRQQLKQSRLPDFDIFPPVVKFRDWEPEKRERRLIQVREYMRQKRAKAQEVKLLPLLPPI